MLRKVQSAFLIAAALALMSFATCAAAPALARQTRPVTATGLSTRAEAVNKQQLIFDAVKARAATITTANGYTSNVGQKVNEWQMTPIDVANDPTLLPCICLNDPVEANLGPPPNSNDQSATRLFGIEFEASLLLAETNQTAAKARQARADFIKAIGTDPRFGGLAVRTEPGDSELVMDADGTRISGVRVKFTVKYNRRPWES